MRLDVTLREASQTFVAEFGEINDLTDGGYDRGYSEGYAAGEAAGYESGYSAGHEKGYIQGHAAGYSEGEDKGYEVGRDQGYIDGYSAGYDTGYAEGYAAGYANGYTEGEAKHTARYATACVTGNGTNALSFSVPFAPDCVTVTYHGADAMSASNAALTAVFDFRCFAALGGALRVRRNGSNMQANVSSANGSTVFKLADGVCTVTIPAAYGTPFLTGTQYICAAVKYTELSDKELLAEEIALLADTGGAIEYSSARVLGTVSEAEWQTLIAQKPNRTFTLS